MDGNVFLFLEQGIQSLERRPRVQNLAFDRILADKDAAGGILFRVAGMDQDAEEMRYIMQTGHLPFVFGAVFECNLICAGRDGCLGVDLFPAGAGTAARGVRTCCRKVPYGILDRVTEKFAADGQVSYGIGRAFEFASEC